MARQTRGAGGVLENVNIERRIPAPRPMPERDRDAENSALYTTTDLLIRCGIFTIGDFGDAVISHSWSTDDGRSFRLTRGFQKGGPHDSQPEGYVSFRVTQGNDEAEYHLSHRDCYANTSSPTGAGDLLGAQSGTRAKNIDFICARELDKQANSHRITQERAVGQAATADATT